MDLILVIEWISVVVQEGIVLLNHGISPYTGDIVHEVYDLIMHEK
jgi:hypothetical protein